MSVGSWNAVRKIIDGMKVDAANTNPPLNDLEQRDEFLLMLINALHLGECVYSWSEPIQTGMQVGTVVYYDADTKVFRPAIKALTSDGKLAPSSFAVGVLVAVKNANVGDLVLYGKVKLDVVSMIEAADQSGVRYVSSATPGMASTTAGSFQLPIGYWRADEKVLLFHPASAGVDNGHSHHKFELVAQAAGTVSENYLQPHVITAADPARAGWLPASHAVFGGLAPAGAKFGYNMAKHPELLAAYPPIPIESAYVMLYLNGCGTSRAPGDIVQVTPTGIWWMRDDWGWAPWAMDASSVFVEEPPEISDPDIPWNPPPVDLQYGHGYMGVRNPCPVRIFLWYDGPAHGTEGGVTTSLKAKEGTPYIITDCEGKPASTGDLVLDFDLDLVAEEGEITGQAVGGVRDNRLIINPSVASVISESAALTITSEHTNPDGSHSGSLKINFKDPGQSVELDTALFALEHAEQGSYQNLFFLTLPANIASGVRGRMDLPYRNVSADMRIKLEMTVFASAAGTPPALNLSYRRMRRPADGASLVAPNSSAELSLPALALSSGIGSLSRPNSYFVAASEAFSASAGDVVYFFIRRAVDSYAGNIGIVNVKAVIQ